MKKTELKVDSKIGLIRSSSYFAVGILLIFLPSIEFNFFEQGTISSKTFFFGYALIFILLLLILQWSIHQRRIEVIFNRLDLTILLLLFFITLNRYFFIRLLTL